MLWIWKWTCRLGEIKCHLGEVMCHLGRAMHLVTSWVILARPCTVLVRSCAILVRSCAILARSCDVTMSGGRVSIQVHQCWCQCSSAIKSTAHCSHLTCTSTIKLGSRSTPATGTHHGIYDLISGPLRTQNLQETAHCYMRGPSINDKWTGGDHSFKVFLLSQFIKYACNSANLSTHM